VQANMITPKALTLIMDALPVCKVRNISYATFTIVDTMLSGQTQVIEMGNPSILHIRDKCLQPLECHRIQANDCPDRDIRMSRPQILPGDRLVFFSDGITMAGLGSPTHKLGLRSRGCSDYILSELDKTPDMSARELAEKVVRKAFYYETDHLPQDDMTCVVIYYRQPRRLLLMTGPPFRSSQDQSWAKKLISYPGDVIVSGGTTANILARELHRDIRTALRPSGGLPASSEMQGVRLTTEGILTLTRVCNLLERNERDDSPATAVIDELKNHDRIDFCVGTKINEAHQDPTLPADLDIRRNIIKRMAAILEQKYLKEIHIEYI
ncbi:MAG TPA: SpoIIE family protein phosphatase, partial [Sedimentisphaerales bacterium]|nr:SpoIIE family protein phosphatase [Sedimentisphaerales bacterium]